MRRSIGVPASVILVVTIQSMARAQMPAGPTPPPPIVQRYREMVKVGRASTHEANERAWSAAIAKSKIPVYTVAMTSMTGANDAWYVSGYSSFKAFDDVNTAMAKDKELTAAVNTFAARDADYVSDAVGSIWMLRPDLSYRDTVNWSAMHAYEMITVRARPGHNGDVKQIVDKLRATHLAAHTSAHWAMYQGAMGVPEGTYLVMVPHASIADLDVGMKEDAQFANALGEAGGKELDKLSADGVISVQTDLYAVSPAMSYVSEAWRTADADFWKGASVMQAGEPTAKKSAKKP
jgi:hypothetical protein